MSAKLRLRRRERYPAGAVTAAIDALELSYSYLRDTKRPVAEGAILDALRRLHRARELHEESRDR